MRKVKRRLRIKPEKGTKRKVPLHRLSFWVSCAFCPASIHSLQLVTGPICLCRMSTSSLLLHTVRCADHSPGPQWVGQQRVRLKQKQVMWTDAVSPAVGVTCTVAGISLSTGLGAGGFHLQLLTNIRQRERCLERKTENPDDWAEPLGQSCPPTAFSVTHKSPQLSCFHEDRLWVVLFYSEHTFESGFLTTNIKRKF